MISQRGAGKVGATPSTANITSGKSTLRLRSHGPATIEDLVILFLINLSKFK